MGPFEILTQQHRELEEQLEAFDSEEGPSGPTARREQLEALATLLQLHVWLEDRHLTPLLEREVDPSMARQEAEDHLAMSELLEELEELEPETDAWWGSLTALEDLVVAHARTEELETFPRITAMLDAHEQDALRRGLIVLREQLLSRAYVVSGNGFIPQEP